MVEGSAQIHSLIFESSQLSDSYMQGPSKGVYDALPLDSVLLSAGCSEWLALTQ